MLLNFAPISQTNIFKTLFARIVFKNNKKIGNKSPSWHRAHVALITSLSIREAYAIINSQGFSHIISCQTW